MQLGMFMQPVHDPKRNYTQALDDDRQTILLADQLGFSEVWVGEHISATAEPIAAPLVFLASLIEQTQSIKLGTGVFCLPLQHPAIVAGQAAMFDHMSKGRFQMGIGTGGLASETKRLVEVRPRLTRSIGARQDHRQAEPSEPVVRVEPTHERQSAVGVVDP